MFEKARLKLTLWYVLFIMLISMSFSLVIFAILSREVERFAAMQRDRLEKRIQDIIILQPGIPLPNPTIISNSEADLIQDLKQRLIFILGTVNLTILVAAGGMSYILAGKTLKPIREMVIEQNRFISDASHELRTPLTSLRSSFEVYLRGKKPNLIEAKVVINDGLDEVKKLQQLSDSLLQLVQYVPNHQSLPFQNVSLDSSIELALRRMKPIALQKNIKFQYEKSNTTLQAMAESLSDLWTIFLDNAIKYSPEKSLVTISTMKKDSHVLISITDQGIGIESKAIPHVFDRFYRASNARNKNGSGGYGLGLSIAKKIVDQHKGSITVKSQKDIGTTFVIKLPLK